MFRSRKGDERRVQPLPLPVGSSLTPATGVPGDAVNEFVMPDILSGLIRVPAADTGGPDQSQPDCVVVGLVGSVLAIGEDSCAERSAHIREVDPLVRGYFELLRLRGLSFDRADVPVVGSHARSEEHTSE